MPKVGIVMGSDSDLKVMSKAAATLEKFGIDYEMTIISAHRMPDVFFDWAKAAEGKGIKVIIVGAVYGSTSAGNVRSTFPNAGNWYPNVRKESGGYGRTLFNRSDATWNPGCYSCNRRRYECGNSCSKDACNVRSGSLEKLKAYSAEMKDTVQAKADRLAEVGYEEYLNNK